MNSLCKTTIQQLEKDNFSKHHLLHCFEESSSCELVGHTIIYFGYRLFIGKELHVEDIYFIDQRRRTGLARALREKGVDIKKSHSF